MKKLQVSGKILASVFLLAFAVRLLSLRGELITYVPSICFSLAAGYAVYLAGKKLKNRRVGLYASIFFLFNPIVVTYSQTVGPQMIGAFVVAALLYAYFFFRNIFIRSALIFILLVTTVSSSIVSKVPLFEKPAPAHIFQNLIGLGVGMVQFDPPPLFYTMAVLWASYLLYIALYKYDKQKLLAGLFVGGLLLTSVSPLLHIVYLAVVLSLLLGLGVESRIQRVRVLVGFLFFIALYLVR